jgi:predicted nucleic acid-binding protein
VVKDPWVLDTSAWVAFYLRECASQEIEAIVSSSHSRGAEIHAPALLYYEFHNALHVNVRRGRCAAVDCDDFLDALAGFPIRVHEPPVRLIRMRVGELAEKHGLTIYDATYLELAERQGAKLKTFDNALLALKNTYPWIN